jgi:hypothetical protein
MKSIIAVFLISFLILGCQTSPRGSIEGQVLEQVELRPLPGAHVTTDPGGFVATSDSTGNFRLSNLPAGNYDLKLSSVEQVSDSYAPHRHAVPYRDTTLHVVAVFADSTTPITVALEPTVDEVHVFYSSPVALSSLLPEWRFYQGVRRSGFIGYPMEPRLKLIAVSATKRRVLLYHTSLKGYVKIGTQRQALEFVRLFTNEHTTYLFKEPNRRGWFLEVRPTRKLPYLGELPAAEFRKLGLAKPVVSRLDKDFIVDRYVFAFDWNLYRIREKVSVDGQYSITDRRIITDKARILFPFYH